MADKILKFGPVFRTEMGIAQSLTIQDDNEVPLMTVSAEAVVRMVRELDNSRDVIRLYTKDNEKLRNRIKKLALCLAEEACT